MPWSLTGNNTAVTWIQILCDYIRKELLVSLSLIIFFLPWSRGFFISHHCHHPSWYCSISCLLQICKVWQCCFCVSVRPILHHHQCLSQWNSDWRAHTIYHYLCQPWGHHRQHVDLFPMSVFCPWLLTQFMWYHVNVKQASVPFAVLQITCANLLARVVPRILHSVYPYTYTGRSWWVCQSLWLISHMYMIDLESAMFIAPMEILVLIFYKYIPYFVNPYLQWVTVWHPIHVVSLRRRSHNNCREHWFIFP